MKKLNVLSSVLMFVGFVVIIVFWTDDKPSWINQIASLLLLSGTVLHSAVDWNKAEIMESKYSKLNIVAIVLLVIGVLGIIIGGKFIHSNILLVLAFISILSSSIIRIYVDGKIKNNS